MLGRATFDRPVAVIGDVHGRADLLESLLARLPKDMPIVHTGDLCDRGPDARKVFDILIARGAVGVRGNHEEWLIALATGQGFDSAALSAMMGGRATLDCYGIEGRHPGAIEAQAWRIPSAHRDFLAALPFALDLTVCGETYWVVHAGVSPSVEIGAASFAEVVPWLAAHKPSALLWTQTQPEDTLPVDRTVIMGHIPLRRPRDAGHVIAVDTGCGVFPDAPLSAVILPDRRFVSS